MGKFVMKKVVLFSILMAFGLTSYSQAGLKAGDAVTVESSTGPLFGVVLDASLKERLVVQFKDGRIENVPVGSVQQVFSSTDEVDAFESSSLEELDSNLQNRQDLLEKRRIAIEKQAAELAKYGTLSRIPKALLGFCQQDNTSDLVKTALYLREFSRRLISTQLNKEASSVHASFSEEKQMEENQEKICKICRDEVNPDLEDSVLLECGHSFHRVCLQETLQFNLKKEKPKDLITCPDPTCHSQISPTQLASIVKDSGQALAVQRMLVRSVDCLKFCPSCGEGIARFNGLLNFAYNCSNCHKDLCFSCGRPPHHDISCKELATDEGVQKAFIRDVLQQGKGDQYGLCPNCKILIEKRDGCSSMTCGQNAADKNQIQFKNLGMLNRSNGCGTKFDWNNRIKLNSGLTSGNDSQSSSSSSSSAQVTPPGQAVVQVPQVAGNAYSVLLGPNDPGYVAEFAALGPQYRITDAIGLVPPFTLSSPGPNTMNQRAAAGCYERVGMPWNRRTEYHPGFCEQNGGNAPTREQFEALARARGRGTPGGYTPLPGMAGFGGFWSSSVLPNSASLAFLFNGTNGNVGYYYRSYALFYYYVVCAR